MNTLLLIIGLLLILGGAHLLTEGSAALAQRFRVPQFIIGLTIVAIGTSTPELVVSLLSAVAGKGDVAIGNVVGSNIFNIFVIGGICALIRPLPLTLRNIKRDIPFGCLVSLLLLLVLMDQFIFGSEQNSINRVEGIVMLSIYFLIMWYTIRKTPRPTHDTTSEAKPQGKLWIMVIEILAGLGGLVFGGDLFLNNAIELARALGVSESVIAITLVAGGTSLPELASSAVSIFKGQTDMALGNIIGSNIANILLILGASATITPLSMGGITFTDIFAVLLGSILLLISAYTFRKKEIDRWEGSIFLILYGGYIYLLLN